MKGQFFPYKDENPSSGMPYVTYALITVNVIIFIINLFDYERIISAYGFTPAYFSIATIFTSMFLHGGIDHLFGNMWYLFIFGDNVEDKLGKVKYVVFYFLSGLAATLTHFLSDINSVIPAIGASGAISGVLGAYLAYFPSVKVHVGSGTVDARFVIGFWFVLQLIFGFGSFLGTSGSGIAFFAHIGGFVFGYVAAKIIKQFSKGS